MRVGKGAVFGRGLLCLCMGAALLFSGVGCGNEGSSTVQPGFDAKSKITVLTREPGSGTRVHLLGALGLEEEGAETLSTLSGTEMMLAGVAADPSALGYASMGTVDSNVQVLKIDGVFPSKEEIERGSYPLVRPFYLVAREVPAQWTEDFIRFVSSTTGEKLVEQEGYVFSGMGETYMAAQAKGKIKISGSTSVQPLMDRLIEAYRRENTGIEVEVNETDSQEGISAVQNGICDLAMLSRKLTAEEEAQGLKSIPFALDAIAVVVHKENPQKELSVQQMKDIYAGRVSTWAQLGT